MDWNVSPSNNISKWRFGLWIWRHEGKWRLRLYRPWRRDFFEVESESFLLSLYILGVGAGWWKDKIEWDGSKTSVPEKHSEV